MCGCPACCGRIIRESGELGQFQPRGASEGRGDERVGGVVTDPTIRAQRDLLPWRATPEERRARLPGDELVPAPLLQTTRAVTMDVPPQQVWPWLVQTGQGRAGFYSDSPFWDRCVDWYYRRLSREEPGTAEVGYHVAADDRVVAS